MLKALLWKEWQEHRWRVALATVWLLGMSTICLRTRILPDVAILIIVWIPAAVILPVFVGMGLFAAERKNGTLAYLMVQPVSRNRILAAKVISGLLAYLIPMVICGMVFWLAVGGREIGSTELGNRIALITVLGVVLFAWQLLAGLRCPREESYILVSVVVLACCVLHAAVNLGFWVWAMNPLAMLVPRPDLPYGVRTVAVVQGLILVGAGLGLWLRFRGLREGKS